MDKIEICIVEDDPDLSEIYCDVLSDDYQVSIYKSAESLIETVVREGWFKKYKVLISDVLMRPMDGVQLVQALRKAKIYMPVIFVSGSSNTDILRTALELRVASYVVKPFAFDFLKAKITRALIQTQLVDLDMSLKAKNAMLIDLFDQKLSSYESKLSQYEDVLKKLSAEALKSLEESKTDLEAQDILSLKSEINEIGTKRALLVEELMTSLTPISTGHQRP